MNNKFEIARNFANKINSDDIVQIILFGSVARGEDTTDSDIDILIVSPIADDLFDKIIDVAVDFLLENEEVISPHLMTEKHYNETIDYPFLTNVLKEGVIIG